MSSDPFHIYIDLDVLNDDLNPTSRPPALAFEETRTHPFLEGNASNYFVTISRFNIQTGSSLPVFIPSILTGQTDINKTVYTCSIKNTVTGLFSTLNIQYVPSNLNTPLPTAPTVSQDYTSRYYYVMNYQDFISMVNTCLATLWGSIGPTGPLSQMVPYIEFDPDKYTNILNVAQISFASTYEIYFNIRMMQLFTGLPSMFIGYDGELNYKINVAGSINNIRAAQTTDQGSTASYQYIQAVSVSVG